MAVERDTMLARLRRAGHAADQRRRLARLIEDCRRLLGAAGRTSSESLAREAIARFHALDGPSRAEFYDRLAADFNPDPAAVQAAADRWAASREAGDLVTLVRTAEPPRQELLRRLNRAPGGTGCLVEIRRDVLGALARRPLLAALEADLTHLLSSWFNPGFLQLRTLDWRSPAHLLEQIIRHEAVHAIDGWADLRRRLAPDRRLFAYFHPALPGEPLIFVEVALLRTMPSAIAPLLDRAQPPDERASRYRVAAFYSISNCQPGLRGIDLGNFLIKRVAEALQAEFPGLSTFCTLSPVPTFAAWLAAGDGPSADAGRSPAARRRLAVARNRVAAALASGASPADDEALSSELSALCAAYLLQTTSSDEGPGGDPVARFHLSNGARLERINVRADLSAKGRAQSHGVMVNYLYDLDRVEAHHEQFVAGGVAASRGVLALL